MDQALHRFMLLLFLGLVASQAHAAQNSQPAPPLSQLSLAKLEQRFAEIDSQLESLASLRMRSGVGAVGFRSREQQERAAAEWIEIDFGEEVVVDQIVLVPSIWRDTKTGFQADGFPVALRIVVGADGDSGGKVIASYGEEDRLLPRIAPLVVDCGAITASWMRVEATTLSPNMWDGAYVLQLSEILAFSGQENIALRKPVKVSSGEHSMPRHQSCLVDGFVPYLMGAREGQRSIAFVSEIGVDEDAEMTIDLGSVVPLSRIHLHATELSGTVPQMLIDGFAFPRRLVVEGAQEPEFSDAVRLIEYRRDSVYDAGPVIMRQFPETRCRYVRLIATELNLGDDPNRTTAQIGFAEIELFSNGQNVALGAHVDTNFPLKRYSDRSISALTDGRNVYGKILPLRGWLSDLARRHDLETERPVVIAELNRRYARQSSNLTRMTWLAALLAVGIGVTILIDRIVRMRQLANMKERFAADLHDELGANLHVIGLLGDLAQKAAVGSPEKLEGLHQRIRVMTERSGTAVEYCTNMLASKELHNDLPADMQRTTERIMADVEGEFSFRGSEEDFGNLKPRNRADLFLFYKECLVNISRHSKATQFNAQLTATPQELCLIVSDNGHGFADSPDNGVPPSLRRRARLLGAHVTTQHPDTGGTCVTLILRTRKWGRRK